VASLVLETRELTTDQADAFVERQARAFEHQKPYLVQRWRAASESGDGKRGAADGRGATARRAASGQAARGQAAARSATPARDATPGQPATPDQRATPARRATRSSGR
jgi:hypothetical protein